MKRRYFLRHAPNPPLVGKQFPHFDFDLNRIKLKKKIAWLPTDTIDCGLVWLKSIYMIHIFYDNEYYEYYEYYEKYSYVNLPEYVYRELLLEA